MIPRYKTKEIVNIQELIELSDEMDSLIDDEKFDKYIIKKLEREKKENATIEKTTIETD